MDTDKKYNLLIYIQYGMSIFKLLTGKQTHLKERDHDKAFYQLCQHMEPNYHQLEFDCRVYLTWKSEAKA